MSNPTPPDALSREARRAMTPEKAAELDQTFTDPTPSPNPVVENPNEWVWIRHQAIQDAVECTREAFTIVYEPKGFSIVEAAVNRSQVIAEKAPILTPGEDPRLSTSATEAPTGTAPTAAS